MNGFKNWSYDQVADLVSHFGFRKQHIKNGSHEIWQKGEMLIELFYRKKKRAYPPDSVKKICNKAGIPISIAKHWSELPKDAKKALWDQYSIY